MAEFTSLLHHPPLLDSARPRNPRPNLLVRRELLPAHRRAHLSHHQRPGDLPCRASTAHPRRLQTLRQHIHRRRRARHRTPQRHARRERVTDTEARDLHGQRDLAPEARGHGGPRVLRDVLSSVSIIITGGRTAGLTHQNALLLVHIHLVGVLILDDGPGPRDLVDSLHPRCRDEVRDAHGAVAGAGGGDLGRVDARGLEVLLRVERGGVEDSAGDAGVGARAPDGTGVQTLFDELVVEPARPVGGEGCGGGSGVCGGEMGQHF